MLFSVLVQEAVMLVFIAAAQRSNLKKKSIPLSTQNHKSSNVELDFHLAMCSPTSSHDGILAFFKNKRQDNENQFKYLTKSSGQDIDIVKQRWRRHLAHSMHQGYIPMY